MNLELKKNALSSITTVSMLLFVVVLSAITFQTWYSSYSSELIANTNFQKNNAMANEIEILEIINNNLYIRSDYNLSISINELRFASILCAVNHNLTLGLNNFSVSACTSPHIGNVTRILLVTNNGLFSKNIIIN